MGMELSVYHQANGLEKCDQKTSYWFHPLWFELLAVKVFVTTHPGNNLKL